MKTPNEFWLCLHQFADAYGAEGADSRQRAESVLQQFRLMPAIARREVLSDFALVAAHMSDLYLQAAAMHRELESQAKIAKNEHVA